MPETSPPLDPLHARAIELLAAGKSTIETARELGVDRTTLFRWRKAPEFQRELAAATNDFINDVRANTRALAELAHSTLARVMHGENDAAACRAAVEVLRTLGAIKEPELAAEATAGKVIQIRFTNPLIKEDDKPAA